MITHLHDVKHDSHLEDWDTLSTDIDRPRVLSTEDYPQVPFVILHYSSNLDSTDVSIRRFVCSKVIGKGSGGTVYETQCGHAVKVVHQVYAVTEEADVLCNIRHPNLLHALYHGQMKLVTVDHKPVAFLYYVFEMARSSLVVPRAMLQSLPFILKINWIKQVYLALCALQDYGYVHGDLHPKNVLWWDTTTIKLCDFGLSFKYNDVGTDEEETNCTCTFPFCSPLALIANDIHEDTMNPEDAKDFQRYVEQISGVSVMDRDHRKCDMFVFGQLISYLLFGGEHFLRGDLNKSAQTALGEFVDYVDNPEGYFDSWWSYVSTKYNVEKECETYGNLSLTPEDVQSVLRGLLEINESIRYTLDDLEYILFW
jgi:serine/threonine protein kinase